MAHGHFPHSVDSEFLSQVSVIHGYMGELFLVHLVDQRDVRVTKMCGKEISFIIGLLHLGQVHGS